MNRLFKAAAVVVAVFLVLGPVKDMALRAALAGAIRGAAGVDAKIGRLSTHILSQSVTARDVKFFNPPGFAAGELVADIPLAEVRVDVPALFRHNLHVPYLRLEVREARVIQGRDKLRAGNLFRPDPVTASGASARPAPADGKAWPIRFDLVSLNIGRIVVEDYSSGKDKPRTTVIDLRQKDVEIRDITSLAQFGAAFLIQAVAPAGIEGFLGSFLGPLGDQNNFRTR